MRIFKTVCLGAMLMLGGLASCVRPPEQVTLDTEPDLIPEGIAVKGRTVWLSSVFHNKIVQADLKTGVVRDFIGTGAAGFGSGVGVAVVDTMLFALSYQPKTTPPSASLFVFDVRSGTVLRVYALQDTVSHFLNDLAVDHSGNVYITDTEHHQIFKTHFPDGDLSVVLADSTLEYPNGIALSADEQLLYVASSTKGVRIVDLKNWQVLAGDAPETRGIDGMKYYDGSLYVVVNGSRDSTRHGVIRIKLSGDGRSVEKIEPLVLGHPMMDIPTTLAIEDRVLYCLANSQLSKLDQQTNTIVPQAKLKPTTLISIPLGEIR